MSAHRHSWAHSNATGASPTHKKCSESSTALRSRDYLIRGEINLVLSRPNKQPTGREKEKKNNQAGHPWFFPAQPRDWLLFRHVRSGITALKSVFGSRECCLCTEVSRGTVIDTSTNPGSGDCMEKSQTPFLQGIYHTQSLSETPQSCPSSISFSTWSCRFLGPEGVFPPSIPGRSLTLLPHEQLDVTSVTLRSNQGSWTEASPFSCCLPRLWSLWAAKPIIQRLSRLFSGGHGKQNVRQSCLSHAAPRLERRNLSPGLTVTDDRRCCENSLLLTLPKCQRVTVLLLKHHRSAKSCVNWEDNHHTGRAEAVWQCWNYVLW